MSEVPLQKQAERHCSRDWRLACGVALGSRSAETDFCIDNLLVRTHFTIVMVGWTGLAPWEFEFPFPGSRASTFQAALQHLGGRDGVGIQYRGAPLLKKRPPPRTLQEAFA